MLSTQTTSTLSARTLDTLQPGNSTTSKTTVSKLYNFATKARYGWYAYRFLNELSPAHAIINTTRLLAPPLARATGNSTVANVVIGATEVLAAASDPLGYAAYRIADTCVSYGAKAFIDYYDINNAEVRDAISIAASEGTNYGIRRSLESESGQAFLSQGYTMLPRGYHRLREYVENGEAYVAETINGYLQSANIDTEIPLTQQFVDAIHERFITPYPDDVLIGDDGSYLVVKLSEAELTQLQVQKTYWENYHADAIDFKSAHESRIKKIAENIYNDANNNYSGTKNRIDYIDIVLANRFLVPRRSIISSLANAYESSKARRRDHRVIDCIYNILLNQQHNYANAIIEHGAKNAALAAEQLALATVELKPNERYVQISSEEYQRALAKREVRLRKQKRKFVDEDKEEAPKYARQESLLETVSIKELVTRAENYATSKGFKDNPHVIALFLTDVLATALGQEHVDRIWDAYHTAYFDWKDEVRRKRHYELYSIFVHVSDLLMNGKQTIELTRAHQSLGRKIQNGVESFLNTISKISSGPNGIAIATNGSNLTVGTFDNPSAFTLYDKNKGTFTPTHRTSSTSSSSTATITKTLQTSTINNHQSMVDNSKQMAVEPPIQFVPTAYLFPELKLTHDLTQRLDEAVKANEQSKAKKTKDKVKIPKKEVTAHKNKKTQQIVYKDKKTGKFTKAPQKLLTQSRPGALGTSLDMSAEQELLHYDFTHQAHLTTQHEILNNPNNRIGVTREASALFSAKSLERADITSFSMQGNINSAHKLMDLNADTPNYQANVSASVFPAAASGELVNDKNSLSAHVRVFFSIFSLNGRFLTRKVCGKGKCISANIETAVHLGAVGAEAGFGKTENKKTGTTTTSISVGAANGVGLRAELRFIQSEDPNYKPTVDDEPRSHFGNPTKRII